MRIISIIKRLVTGLMVFSVLLCTGCASHEPLDFTPLDEFLVRVLPRIDYGCCLILFQGDDIVYRKSFGNFSLETVVPVASASKWISGGVIASLIDQDLLSLDTRASEYLDNFTDPKADITIRQMFSHTHGFPEKTPADFYLPNYFPHRDTDLNSIQEAVDIIAEVPLVYLPGNALYYSGMGMQVAGRIAEIVTGKSWVDIFQENIGEPCEMNHTTYYAYGTTGNPNVAGSVETCLDDYGNFVHMLLNGGVFNGRQVLSEEAVEAILSNQSGSGLVLKHPWSSLAFVDPVIAVCRYGIGCWLENMDPSTGRGIEISSGGAYGCNPFVYRNLNVGGVFLTFSRNLKLNEKREVYNDAHRVYLELQEVIKDIFSP